MTDLATELSELCATTIGASVDLAFLKNKQFKVKINRGNDVRAEQRPAFKDIDSAIEDAISYLKERRWPLKDFVGVPPGCTHSIKRENSWK